MKSPFTLAGPERTPSRPGPGAISVATLEALELSIGRRIDGLLTGDYRSAFAGLGSELYQVRPYEFGDDVRRIDWNVTARTTIPHVRVESAERVLMTWIVYDASASMILGTADRRKADVAEGAALAVGHVASRRSNRLGVVVFGPETAPWRRPQQGRRALLGALAALRSEPGGNGTLLEALRRVDSLALQRAVVVVISDFRGPSDWRTALLRLAARNPTFAIEIRDRREQQLVDVGEIRLRDPETGRQVLVNTRDADIRERFARAAVEEREALVRTLSSVGVRHLALSTEGDWLRPLAAFLKNTKR